MLFVEVRSRALHPALGIPELLHNSALSLLLLVFMHLCLYGHFFTRSTQFSFLPSWGRKQLPAYEQQSWDARVGFLRQDFPQTLHTMSRPVLACQGWLTGS